MRQPPHEPERTCILTRETAPPGALIRLALGPGGEVMPDLAARAPGRGAWLGVDAGALRAAQAKGRLKGALARAFKGDARQVPDDLAAAIGDGLERRAMDRIGLEMKAGHLTFGFERVHALAKAGAAHLVLHAADAAQDGAGKIDRVLLAARQATLQSERREAKSVRLPVGREALSMALGQGNVVHVGVTDAGAAARIGAAITRWQTFLGLDGRNDVSGTGTPEGVERQV